MKFRTIALITTAMSFPLAAHAAPVGFGNEAYLEQDGSGNVATIDQSGGFENKVGKSGGEGARQEAATSPNTLTITQSGNNNEVGTGANASGGSALHQLGQFVQKGNTATITQTTNGNSVEQIGQTARNGNPSDPQGNLLTITQEGGDHNYIGRVIQDRERTSGNTMDITMTGTGNSITTATQASYAEDNGPPLENGNTMTVTMTGDNNGVSGLNGFAFDSGATSSVLQQGKRYGGSQNNNQITLTIDNANDTAFGIRQLGVSNTVNEIRISGNSNEVGAVQEGLMNTIDISEVSGADNNIGMAQTGNMNFMDVDVFGNNNEFGVDQNMDMNNAYLTVDGNDNGFVGTSPLYAGLSVTEGLVSQDGMGNLVDASFTGDVNAFGIKQLGNDNEVSGATTGSNNALVVAQAGDGNIATFSQAGNNNTATINQ